MTGFVFKTSDSGKLEFHGDFEGLYRSDTDPWGQSGGGDNALMNEFYRRSRDILCDRISSIHNLIKGQDQQLSICEVGAGTGFFANMLKQTVPDALVCGVDISETAITKARRLFPGIEFDCGDILAAGLNKRHDIFILSNLLWYVIHDLPNLISNVVSSLKVERRVSYLVVQNALFKNGQSYGAEVVSTIGSMTDLFVEHLSDKVEIVSVNSELHRANEMHHDFGLVVIELRQL
jgi:SAM-dependent methyltransferase